ncbi:MAG: hypothetical protein V3W14_06815 [Candidatus Neomarinimicrobiota bacterium]
MHLLAAPLAWYAMHRWLADFAYRVDIGMLPFVAAALLVVVVALSTVAYQAVKAAIANPVDAIRYE